MAKQNSSRQALTHPNAPHNQSFCVPSKPGKKRKTWWNGHRTVMPRSKEE